MVTVERVTDAREDIETADGIRLGTCASCDCPHLFLLDMNGDAFAEVVLHADVLREFITALLQVLATMSQQESLQ